MRNKVLVVDDEQSIVTLLQYNLEQAGFEVITAMDGETGRDCSRKRGAGYYYFRSHASKIGWHGGL